MFKENHTKERLLEVKVGDEVIRMVWGIKGIHLKVTSVTDKTIVCGPWVFSNETGGEIDEDLDWDGVNRTGSYLKFVESTN